MGVQAVAFGTERRGGRAGAVPTIRRGDEGSGGRTNEEVDDEPKKSHLSLFLVVEMS